MNNPESIFDKPLFTSENYNVVNSFTGNDMTVDTLFFNPSQCMNYGSPATGDVCLFFFDGIGKCYLKNTSESSINVTRGSIVYIPNGVSYKIENGNEPMIVVQSSSANHH